MIGPEHERPRPAQGEGFGDSVTFSFADRESDLYGLARLGLAPQEEQASALAVLFSGTEPLAARTESVELAAPHAWSFTVGEVATEVLAPLGAWRVVLDGAFDLRFEAISEAIDLGGGDAARASGLEGYEQLSRVEGEVTVRGRTRPLICLGQRGHGWGPAPWERIELARSVCAWLDDGTAVTLAAVRPAAAAEHAEEALTAFLVDPAESPPVAVDEPRLSTTYDADGHQLRAGLELWVGPEDEMPRRVVGEVSCGTTFELGRLRLDCAFFSWRMEGRAGAGRYDVLRRA